MATLKQRRAAKTVENSRSMRQALKRAGYAQSTCDHPKRVTETKGWEELVAKELPDNILFPKTKQLMEATKTVSAIAPGKDADAKSTDFIDVPDNSVQLGATKLAWQLRGKLVNRVANGDGTNISTIDFKLGNLDAK